MWNMQSGIRRRTFKLGVPPSEVQNRVHSSNSSKQKERAVTGLATDPLNQWLIACTLDGTVNVSVGHAQPGLVPNQDAVLRLQNSSSRAYTGVAFSCGINDLAAG